MDVDQLSAELVEDEGLETKLYQCTAGKNTIGVGRNLDDVGISREEALFLLRNDILRVERELDKRWPYWRQLNETRQRVVANMVFNLGINGFLTFKTTISLIEAGQYDAASVAMLNSRWASQVGDRAKRLAARMANG